MCITIYVNVIPKESTNKKKSYGGGELIEVLLKQEMARNIVETGWRAQILNN